MVFFSEAYLRNKLFLEQALAVNPMGAYPDGTNARGISPEKWRCTGTAEDSGRKNGFPEYISFQLRIRKS